MLSTDEVFTRVVTDGARRRRRRRSGLVAGAAVVALVAGAVALRAPSSKTTVSVAAVPSTTVIAVPDGVKVAGPLPTLATEAREWTAVAPTARAVQQLAAALGVEGNVIEAIEGNFALTRGPTTFRVAPAGGIPGWGFEMGQCPAGACRAPLVVPTGPMPEVEVRDAPDHPPFEAAPIAADAARRIAAALGNVVVPRLQMSLAEWWAQFQWLAGAQPVEEGFTVHIQPDGSIRMAYGFMGWPGEPGPVRRLVGIEEGLRRLVAPGGVQSMARCVEGPCPVIVTGVRLGLSFGDDRFVPAYVFTLEGGAERVVSAV